MTACLSDRPLEPPAHSPGCLCNDEFRNNWAACREPHQKRQVLENESDSTLSAILSDAVQIALDSACLPSVENEDRDELGQPVEDTETPADVSADAPVDSPVEPPETAALVDPALGPAVNEIAEPSIDDVSEQADSEDGGVPSMSIEATPDATDKILSQSVLNQTALVENFLTTTTSAGEALSATDDEDSDESTSTATAETEEVTTATTPTSDESQKTGSSSEDDANQASGTWGSIKSVGMAIVLAAIMFTL